MNNLSFICCAVWILIFDQLKLVKNMLVLSMLDACFLKVLRQYLESTMDVSRFLMKPFVILFWEHDAGWDIFSVRLITIFSSALEIEQTFTPLHSSLSLGPSRGGRQWVM